MRIVNEIPEDRGRTKYPWEEIRAAIDSGQVVELDPNDYPYVKTVHSLRSSVYSYAMRNGLKWRTALRGELLYIAQDQP